MISSTPTRLEAFRSLLSAKSNQTRSAMRSIMKSGCRTRASPNGRFAQKLLFLTIVVGNRFLIASQNSLGPGRSCLALQVMTVAMAIMMAIPAILMATCMGTAPEDLTNMTWPMNASKMLRQYIASEFSPQRIIAFVNGFVRPRQSDDVRRKATTANAKKGNNRAGARIAFIDRVDQLGQRLGHKAFKRLDLPAQSDGETEREIAQRNDQRSARLNDGPQPASPLICISGAEHEQHLPGQRIKVQFIV
jgi:hypothetical protein